MVWENSVVSVCAKNTNYTSTQRSISSFCANICALYVDIVIWLHSVNSMATSLVQCTFIYSLLVAAPQPSRPACVCLRAHVGVCLYTCTVLGYQCSTGQMYAQIILAGSIYIFKTVEVECV